MGAWASADATVRLAGLRAVVTGASSGIGRAIAESFAANGARVLITYRTSARAARAVVQRIGERGGEAEAVRADLATGAGCRALVEEAVARLATVDIWVNNAGADILTGEAASLSWERKLELLLAVDVKGTIACSRAIATVMAGQTRGGSIINMSWDHAVSGMAGEEAQLFSAAKGAVLAYSKSLARTVAPRVRVNVLCPGWIRTAFGRQVGPEVRRSIARSIPLGRWGTPADVAGAAVYLASREAAFVTGQALNINGGQLT